MAVSQIIFLVGLLVGLASVSVVGQDLKPVDLEDLLNGRYRHRQMNATWISDTGLVYESDDGFYKYDVTTKTASLLFPQSVLDNYTGASVTVTRNAIFAIIKYNVKSIYRHSVTAQYAIYDIINSITYDVADKKFLQIVIWTTEGSGFAYVYENNLYYMESPSANPVQITFDGVPGVIYNGITDWVYEEEVFGSGKVIWFSPEGDKLAFATFDDTDVHEFSYFKYGEPGSLEDLYPQTLTVRYPKVGTTNPKFKLSVVELSNPTSTTQLNITADNSEEFVLTNVVWPNNDEVTAVVQPRVQNCADMLRCFTNSGLCQHETFFCQQSGWIAVTGPIYNKEATLALFIAPQEEGDDNFNHLIMYNVSSLRYDRLTTGRKVVESVLGWDKDNNEIYYSGSANDSPTQKHAYVLNVDTLEDKCLTCDMQTPEGVCKYASASLSSNFTNIIKTCSGPGPVYAVIEKLQEAGEPIVWEDNTILRQNLTEVLKPTIKDLTIDLDDGVQVRARLYLPPGLDESGTQKYPAIVDVYGGPDSNKILDSFSLGFKDYIITSRKYVYINIDGRGSGRNGNKNMHAVYKKLGTLEIEDQISATKYLQNNLPYIDKDNTAIWGWSYGGFAAAWALVQDNEKVFKSALSVAPVVNFVYYDSIYTERYMSLLEYNSLGYNNTDLTRRAEDFRNKSFFLIHGNADDNVHYQQSMLLSRALELADVPFRQQSYPDENHALGGVSKHLYHTIDRFWADTFSTTKEAQIKCPVKLF